ncbi:MAG: hypothetical protein H7Z42_08860, partial [Roseiflexaceae bacterium]|nr:hypothetical protein [Roseiflexaceae bacterium]
ELLGDVVRAVPQFAGLLNAPEQASLATWQAFGATLSQVVWPVPWMREMVQFYEALEQKHLRSASYYLLVWETPDVSPEALVLSVQQATGRTVQLCSSLPPVIGTTYQVDEQRSQLRPATPGHPHLAVLRSYDIRGTWDAETLHPLLAGKFDVSLAIDVRTFPHHRLSRALELAKRTALAVISEGKDDPQAVLKYQQADQGMYRINSESLHDVQIAVLVHGETAEALATNLALTRDKLGSALRLDAVAGAQAELIKLWSTTPTTKIDAPLRARNMWSHGVGCALGVLGFHRASRTDGLAWGLDALRRAPLFYDLFADNQAAHAVVLGKTGFGKSFFLNVVTLRAAAQLGYRVVAMDAFKNGARIEAAADGGAVCNWLDGTTPINVLDIIYDERDGDWRPRQVQHAVGQLSMLFGKPKMIVLEHDIKEVLTPCEFSDAEEGVLDRALSDLYAGLSANAQAPLLRDLIGELERIDEPEARSIARRLRFKLYGSSTSVRLTALGQMLDAPTGVDWSFANDINYFDFSQVPEQRRAFYYAHMVGAFNRFMRDPRRDVTHRTLFLMDEFHYITRVEAVARLAADVSKVARKYGVGLMPVDQNPQTFLDNTYGRQIFENAVAKFMFHLDDLPARQMAGAISDLTPDHVAFLARAGRGQCLAAFGNDIYTMLVEASPQELRMLRGS